MRKSGSGVGVDKNTTPAVAKSRGTHAVPLQTTGMSQTHGALSSLIGRPSRQALEHGIPIEQW